MLTHETDPSQVANETVGGHKIRHLTYEADRGHWPWMGEYLADERWQHTRWGFGGLFNGGTSHDKRDLQPAPVAQPVVDWEEPIQLGDGTPLDLLCSRPSALFGMAYVVASKDSNLVLTCGADGKTTRGKIINTPPEPECVRVAFGTRIAWGSERIFSERIFIDVPKHNRLQVLDQYGSPSSFFAGDDRLEQAAKSYDIREWHTVTK